MIVRLMVLLSVLMLFSQAALAESAGPWCSESCCQSCWDSWRDDNCACFLKLTAGETESMFDCLHKEPTPNEAPETQKYNCMNVDCYNSGEDCTQNGWTEYSYNTWDDCNVPPCYDCPDDDAYCDSI